MGEKPYIQYQAESLMCEEVAMSVFKKLEFLYNYSGIGEELPKKKGKKIDVDQDFQLHYREPRGTLVIMDRTFDLVTPLIHDY